jgi:DNA-binding NarL/FixJ family response regulator
MPRARPPRLSILVVHGERTFGESLAIALQDRHSHVARAAATEAEALAVLAESLPDVVLADGRAGAAARTIRRILDTRQEAEVIALVPEEGELARARVLDAGAVAFLPTSSSVAEIADAVVAVHQDRELIGAEERRELARALRRARIEEATEQQRAKRLTSRQTEILQLMADGMSSRDIADRLGLSPNTLRTHVYNILTRLGAHSKLEAMAVAIRQGMVSTGGG